MVYINAWGTTEPFTGAYDKRIEENRSKAAAQANKTERENSMTARKMLGRSIEISQESKTFMAGVEERKAAQRAAIEAAKGEKGKNAFDGTGDFKKQYLVLSENLYRNGFYENLSDDEVRDMEGMLRDITAGMESINRSGINRNFSTEISHEGAKLELLSSVNALNYFADQYVPEKIRDSFKEMIRQYESYNSEKVEAHKSIYDLHDMGMAQMPAPSGTYLSTATKKQQEETKAGAAIGKVSHTKEQEQANKEEYQALFEKLMAKQDDAANIFGNLQSALVRYASGNSTDSTVLTMLNSRNAAVIHNMWDYWSRLL